MKIAASKLTLFAGAMAVTCLIGVSASRAADDNAAAKESRQAQAKAKQEAEVLRKYDKNANGVLDPDELAARQANQEKMKGVREARKKKNGERSKEKGS